MVTEEDIRRAIRHLSMDGTAVCLHSSLSSFGWVDRGAASVVGGFLAEGCTLLAPSFSDVYRVPPPPHLRPERNGYHYENVSPGSSSLIYDVRSKLIDKDMGAVSQFVVGMSSRWRGNHAIQSFSGVGPLAESLVGTQRPWDIYGPLQAVADVGGFAVLAGVGYGRLTLLHLAEKRAGRTPFLRWANDENAKPFMLESGGCSAGFGAFAPHLNRLAKRIQVGRSTWIVLPVRETLELAVALIERTPGITSCNNAGCERCADAMRGGPIE